MALEPQLEMPSLGHGPERDYIYLPWDRVLQLPLPFDAAEFVLSGNHSLDQCARHLHAFYDESSRTGAVWTDCPFPRWTFSQPILRKQFFEELVPMVAKEIELWNGAVADA